MSGANTGLESVESVLLDTSYVIRLLKADDPLSGNAKAWFRELLDRKTPMYLSTIVIAEYCVKGSFEELPIRNVRVLPFNVDHARRAGSYTGTLLSIRAKGGKEERNVVLNDVKLLAQAEATVGISHILTKDNGFRSRIGQLRGAGHVLGTEVLDLNIAMSEALGRLNFPE